MRTRGHRRGRPPVGWILARGIHRRVVGFLALTLVVGLGAGVCVHIATLAQAPWTTFLCLGLSVAGLTWPLAWVAAWRIAWPLRELAQVAGQIHGGRLQSRLQLPDGPAEVGEVSHALRSVADRVAKQLQDQRALMAAVSHELRSPLARARVLIEMAREGSAPPSLHDDLQAEIDAMDDLVGDLLAAARIDFEAVAPVRLEATDVAKRAASIAGLPESALVIDGEAGSLQADPTLLSRALAGLLDNAKRYGAQTVRLHVRGRSSRVRFEVEDDGPGFAPGDEERAFQPFWRAPATEGSAPPKGEGLGLALVRQIAAAHGGEAGAENVTPHGARVWIELPRHLDVAAPQD